MRDCNVLIVDDDKDDIGFLAEALTQVGVDSIHYVFSAMLAFIYLETVAADCLPKLVITDFYVPGMNGSEFLKKLKGMGKYRHIPVIVLSTENSPKEIQKHRQMGALDYLIKPSSYEVYLAVAAEMKRRVEE